MHHHDQFFYFDKVHWHKRQDDKQMQTIQPKRSGWYGYGDSCKFNNGITLSRGDIVSTGRVQEAAMPFKCYFGIHIVLDANYNLYVSSMRQTVAIRGNQIWCREGDFGEVSASWEQSGRSRIISLDFTQELIAQWGENYKLPKWLTPSFRPPLSKRQLAQQSQLMIQADQILSQPANTLYDRIKLESLTLSLCASIIKMCDNKRSKIDDCLDIIHTEYNCPLSISSLARRVGTNECYLKRDFKIRTGTSIAAYVRNLRMREAMRILMDENKTLKEVAFYVGYRDSAHFSRRFKALYGVSPTELIRD